MSNLYISFHGGSTGTSVNNLLASDDLQPLLAPSAVGVLPALCELRGFLTDTHGTLYVVNAYKDFSNILTFSPPAAGTQTYTFASIFASGAKDGLAHPFGAVFGPDGDLYVSNQDTLPGQKSSAVTRYEGPTKTHPGKYKGVFADKFVTLRGIATDNTYWYFADEGDSKNPGTVWIYDSNGKESNSLSIDDPVHLLYDGSQYLYIGSEAKNEVYQYDTKNGGQPVKFVTSTAGAPLDDTSGLAISGEDIFVGSRKGMSVNQYPLSNPSGGSTFVENLPDNPEFLLFL